MSVNPQAQSSRLLLTDVSINLRPGEVLGLSGLRGAGRTETAKAIAGALPLDSGQVTVSGGRLRKRSIAGAIRAGVGLLPDDRLPLTHHEQLDVFGRRVSGHQHRPLHQPRKHQVNQS